MAEITSLHDAVVAGRERHRPLLEAHLADLGERRTHERLGRLVVEEEPARGVDEEDRLREVGGQLPRQDHLDGVLRHGGEDNPDPSST